jgi:hypothetical protein
VSKQKADRAEDELKANLHSLSLVTDEEPEIPEKVEDEETMFKIEDIPITMELPLTRFNAALAVGLDDKLYIYGGTYERPGSGELTLDDFHVIDLGRLDGVRALWDRKTIVEESEGSEEDEDDEDDESMPDEEESAEPDVTEEMVDITPPPIETLVQETASEATEETTSSFNPSFPQPLPFESLKSFYDRTAKDWLVLMMDKSKAGRRDAFVKAEGYWWECREEIREMEERMEESGVKEVIAMQADRKEKRR